MVYIIGDRHGLEDGFSDDRLPGQSRWTANDSIIVTGDFGYIMRGEDKDAFERQQLDKLAQKPYQILFVDGNHEGFDALEKYPEEIRFDAPVRKIRDNIFWLQRGYAYTIQEQIFFTMGGAYSLDKAYRLSHQAIYGEKIWFEQELPTNDEYKRAISTLAAHNHSVDYIITHTTPPHDNPVSDWQVSRSA